jgi:kynureninase
MACLASCFDFAPARNRVVYESLMFPTVSYVWKAEERRGAEVVLVEPSADGTTIDADAVCAAIDERTLAGADPARGVLVGVHPGRQEDRPPRGRGRRPRHPRLLPVDRRGADRRRRPRRVVRVRRLGQVPVRRAGRRLAVRPQGSDRPFEPRATGWFANAHPFAFTMPSQTYADTIWRYLSGTPAIAALYQSRAGQTIIGEIGVARSATSRWR